MGDKGASFAAAASLLLYTSDEQDGRKGAMIEHRGVDNQYMYKGGRAGVEKWRSNSPAITLVVLYLGMAGAGAANQRRTS